MKLDNVLMIIALLCMVFTVVITVVQFIGKSSKERVKFLRNYKKGRFFLIYISSCIIHFANSYYKIGKFCLENFTEALKHTVNSLVFKIEYSNIKDFLNESIVNAIIIYFFYILLALNALLFIASLFYPTIISWKKKYIDFKGSENKLIFIGYNDEVAKLMKTAKGKYEYLVLEDIDEKTEESFLGDKIAFIDLKSIEVLDIKDCLKKLIKKCKIDNVKIVVHTLDENRNLILTKQIKEIIEEFSDLDVNAYVIGSGECQTAFTYYCEQTSGRIRFINKHNLIAVDFIDRYPMTKFMNDNHIDRETATIKEDINLNMFLIGYGKTNQELFLASVANNQFVSLVDGEVKHKIMNYFIYDNKKIKNNKNLNHYYYRLQNEKGSFKGRENEYLPLDIDPAVINTRDEIDINDPRFYEYLYSDLSNTNENDINYVVISFGSKTENIDMANKLVSKIYEWNINKQTKLFVRTKDSHYVNDGAMIRKVDNLKIVSDEEYSVKFDGKSLIIPKLLSVKSDEKLYYSFGEEDKIILDVDRIFNDKEEIKARNRDAVYSLEYCGTNEVDEEIIKGVYKDWYKKSQIQRDSNFYACLNLRTKLNLLGFDYVNEDEFNEEYHTLATFDDFYKEYFKDSKVEPLETKEFKFDGKTYTKNVYIKTLNYANCRRTYLGIQEHLRWNAYTISKGVIPCTRQEIISSIDNGKDYVVKRTHNSLTTFEGLYELGKILAVKKYITNLLKGDLKVEKEDMSFSYMACKLMTDDLEKCFELFDKLSKAEKDKYLYDCDVIKYDFQILDDLEWLFKISGFKLIKRS